MLAFDVIGIFNESEQILLLILEWFAFVFLCSLLEETDSIIINKIFQESSLLLFEQILLLFHLAQFHELLAVILMAVLWLCSIDQQDDSILDAFQIVKSLEQISDQFREFLCSCFSYGHLVNHQQDFYVLIHVE